jgi:hypothetical protein
MPQAVEPMPDYWTALLWKRLMGQRVLRATVLQSGTLNVMAFAHCSAISAGGVSMLLINTDHNIGANVTLVDAELQGLREEYVLSKVGQHGIALNGKVLAVTGKWGSWKMPSLEGRQSNPSNNEAAISIGITADSYLFLEFPGAAVSACQTP